MNFESISVSAACWSVLANFLPSLFISPFNLGCVGHAMPIIVVGTLKKAAMSGFTKTPAFGPRLARPVRLDSLRYLSASLRRRGSPCEAGGVEADNLGDCAAGEFDDGCEGTAATRALPTGEGREWPWPRGLRKQCPVMCCSVLQNAQPGTKPPRPVLMHCCTVWPMCSQLPRTTSAPSWLPRGRDYLPVRTWQRVPMCPLLRKTVQRRQFWARTMLRRCVLTSTTHRWRKYTRALRTRVQDEFFQRLKRMHGRSQRSNAGCLRLVVPLKG